MPVKVLQPNARVSELIDHQSEAWNLVLVRQIFFEHETDTILTIPLRPSLPPDSRVWAFTASGHFSVASAYRVALQAKSESQKNGGSGEQILGRCNHSGSLFGNFRFQIKFVPLYGVLAEIFY